MLSSLRNRSFGLSTEFAPAERASESELRAAIEVATASPIVTAILDSFDGLVLILNPERQLVAGNYAFLERIGVESPEECLGFRAGELLGCIHSTEQDGGCGCSEACASCGAAAMVASQAADRPVERECLVTVRKGDATESVELGVRVTPMVLDGRKFLVTCLHDISDAKRRFALEQVFFHDVLNTLTALVGHCKLLKEPEAAKDQAAIVDRTIYLGDRLTREVLGQRMLVEAENGVLEPAFAESAIAEVVERVARVFRGHPVAGHRSVEVAKTPPEGTMVTDTTLLERVLVNMVKNALEATPRGGTVRIWCEPADAGAVSFFVWNEGAIPRDVAVRVFHRSFSTKAASGRGLGTYAMKLFGERYLGGKVAFTSTAEEGTTFSISLPLVPPA